MGLGYDILTAPHRHDYSVPVNRRAVGDGDVAVVYRVEAGAPHRDPGRIVAVARINSSSWQRRDGHTAVSWHVRTLPLEAWISSVDMKASGLWTNRVPFTSQAQASSPVELGVDQWSWIADRLPAAARTWLEEHAAP
jgi:hypothetical protein